MSMSMSIKQGLESFFEKKNPSFISVRYSHDRSKAMPDVVNRTILLGQRSAKEVHLVEVPER